MAENNQGQTVTDDPKDNKQTVMAESLKAGTITTDNIAGDTADIKIRQPLSEQPIEEQLSFWRQASRKHEQQAKSNYDQLQKTNTALEQTQHTVHDLQAENARLKVQRKYPQITDDTFYDLCRETDPEGIEAWAEKYMKHVPSGTPVQQQGEPVRDKAEKLARMHGQGAPAIRTGSYEEGYEAAKARQEQKRQARSAK